MDGKTRDDTYMIQNIYNIIIIFIWYCNTLMDVASNTYTNINRGI